MDHIRTGAHSRQRVNDTQAPIVVTVPADHDLFAGWFHHLVDHKFHQRARTFGRRMANSVCQHDMTGTAIDGRRIEPLDGFRKGSSRIFRYVHDGNAAADAVSHRFFRSPHQVVHCPVLDVLADHARAQECGGVNDDSGFFRNVDDGIDILDRGTSRTIRTDLHAAASDLGSQSESVVVSARTSAGKADIEHLNAKILHQVHEVDLVVYGRIGNGG